MKSVKNICAVAIISALTSGSTIAANFVFLDEATLAASRTLLKSEQATDNMKQSYQRLLEEAGNSKNMAAFSVTHKGFTPPSGDKHDYMSISPYWWPDTTKADGLPWIRHDGKTNPASKSDETDSVRIGTFTRSVRALALAYYFSEDNDYAKKAIEMVRTWYINADTRMNPNVNFGQGVPGVADGRRSGIIDTRTLVERNLDAIAILSQSSLWTDADEAGINQWYSEYLDWMIEDDLSGGPKGEAYAPNNHGTWYDYQIAGIAYFLGNIHLTKQMVQKGKVRVDSQFAQDGSQPHEAQRTRSYHYHYFSLDPLVGIAQLGDKVGIDLWNYQNEQGASLTKGIEFMIDYHDPSVKWPFPEKDSRRVERMTPLYLKAGAALNNPQWINLAKEADFEKATVSKNLAEVWAQRDIELLYRVK
ncbi:alginate lyase family protein [Shewanella holmiensis]|uniref:Alginate lyase family protein n=1 Tax=Shewanella holmiensis TaxID=2952222 RepID=A0A9X2WPK6_9GAMM|nr:alginate lyase family protein [Shewanella holmiensis]MCT7943013.1 alginate lyase family protein [Shewanella holmiensis]